LGWNSKPVSVADPRARFDDGFGIAVAISGKYAFAGTFGVEKAGGTYIFSA
jgi:hypothetical protein